MKYGVRLKIDVSKINKEKLFKGQKGTYLDATVFLDVDNKDQYDNNGMITQDAPKGEQGAILGNAQVFWNEGQQAPQQRQQQPQNNQQSYQGSGNYGHSSQQAQTSPMAEPDFDMDDTIPF